MNRHCSSGGRAADPASAPSSADAAAARSRSRMPGLLDCVVRRRPAWLECLKRPTQEHPVPRIALVSLTVGGLLLVIGALLPWSDTTIPVVGTINGEEVVTGVQRSRPLGVAGGGMGGITLGIGIVLTGIATLLWERGLRDVVGFGLPFLAAIAVVVAGLKFDDISGAVRQFNALYEGLDPRAHASIGAGLYVTLVGGIVASLGALRVSIATRKAGKDERAGEERAGGARPRRR